MSHNAILIAALIAGATYLPASWLVPDGAGMLVWKGAGVALLAIWAAANARTAAGWWITAVLALGAAGDVLIDAIGLTAGACAFLAGHVLATGLYLRERRRDWTAMLTGVALARVTVIPTIAFLLPADRAAAPGIALYALGLGAMAASASLSRFPLRRVSLGALMFAVSDLLIFARLGPLAGSPVPDLLVWPLYFAGQALIATGVVATLSKEGQGAESDGG